MIAGVWHVFLQSDSSTMLVLVFLATALSAVHAQIVSTTGYVPSRSLQEIAQGDIQLKQAWEAAFSVAMSDGTWVSTIGNDPAFLRSESCLPNPALYPWPIAPVGALYDVLQSSSIRAGYVIPKVANTIYSPNGQLWMNAAGQGVAWDFYQAVAQRLGAAYSRSYITISPTGYPNANAALEALYAGKIDMLVGVSAPIDLYKALHRGYVATMSQCFPFLMESPVYVAQNNNDIFTIGDLRSYVSDAVITGRAVRMGVLSQQAADTVRGLLLNPASSSLNVTIYGTTTSLFADLNNNMTDVVYPSTYFVNNATGAAAYRLLPSLGYPLGYMTAASYFRSPLLNGALSTQIPTTNAIVYPPPPTTDPLAVGDVQLNAALTAAMNRIIRDGSWAQAWQPTGNLGYAPLEHCAGDINTFPFPPASGALGAFADMLNSGELRAGYYAGSNLTAYNGAVLQGTTPGLQVFGMGSTLMNALAHTLSTNYGRTITVKWTVSVAQPGYPNAANNLWGLLTSRQIDVLAPTLLTGGDINTTVARDFMLQSLTCDSYVSPTITTVRATESRFQTNEQLLAYLAAGNTLNIGAQTQPATITAKAFFGATANVTMMSTAALFAALTAPTPTLDVVFRSSPPSSLASQVKRLQGTVSLAVYTIFVRPPLFAQNATIPAVTMPGVAASMLSASACANNASGSDKSFSAMVGLSVATALLTVVVATLMYCVIASGRFGRNSRPSMRLWAGGSPASHMELPNTTISPLGSATAVNAMKQGNYP